MKHIAATAIEIIVPSTMVAASAPTTFLGDLRVCQRILNYNRGWAAERRGQVLLGGLSTGAAGLNHWKNATNITI
jgi:hypothetical protein